MSGAVVVGLRVLLLLDAQDVGGAAIAGEEVPAVLGVEEAPERLDAADDHQEVVADPSPPPCGEATRPQVERGGGRRHRARSRR